MPSRPTPIRARLAAASLLALAAPGCRIPVPEPYYARCDATGSADWKAEVQVSLSNHPKPVRSRRLVVTGRVQVPTGGYSVALVRGPIARLEPPVQQLMVHTTAPADAATQAMTWHGVRAEVPALRRYGAVEIRCGDGVIARIKDVPVPPTR
jgi:hypothetical protein